MRAANGVSDYSFAVHPYLEQRDTIRANCVAGRQVVPPDDSAESHQLALRVDRDVLGTVDRQVSIRQYLDHARRDRRGQYRFTAGLALALQFGLSGKACEIREPARSWPQQGGKRGGRARLTRRVGRSPRDGAGL